MTATVSPIEDVIRVIISHRNILNRPPRELHMSQVTMRAVLLDPALRALLSESEVENLLQQWQPGAWLCGSRLVLDPHLPAGAIHTESIHRS